MDFEYQGKRYATLRASDLPRDGMALELLTEGETVAEVFYSDASGEFTISLFRESLPLPVAERLISVAREVLPPVAEG